MVRHIVMFKILDRHQVNELSSEIKKRLMELPVLIPSLMSMEVGLNINTKPAAFDLVLVSDFADDAGLEAYQTHPEHQKVVKFIKETVEKSIVVDYYL